MKKREKKLKAKAVQSRHKFKFTDDEDFVMSNTIFERQKPKALRRHTSGDEETKEDATLSIVDNRKPHNAFQIGRSITTPGGSSKTVGAGDFLSMAALGGVLLDTAAKPQANGDDSIETVHNVTAKPIGLPPPPNHIRRGVVTTAEKAPRPLSLLPKLPAEVYLDMDIPIVEADREDPVPLLDSHTAEGNMAVVASSDSSSSSFTEASLISKAAARQGIMPRDMLPPRAPPPPSKYLGRVDELQHNSANDPILTARTILGGEGRNALRITAGLRGPGLRLTSTRETDLALSVARFPTDVRPSTRALKDAGLSSLELSLERFAEVPPPNKTSTQVLRKRDPSSWIEERRIDINGDGDPLTKVEFEARYGGSTMEWESSPIKR
jgi:hypothetical protein